MSCQKTSFVTLSAMLLTIALAFGWQLPAVSAASMTALTSADLIQTIEDANDEVSNPGPDTIDLGGNIITLTASYADYNGATALPQITSDITIQNGTIERDSATTSDFRLLAVDASGILTLNNVTGRNGFFSPPADPFTPEFSGGAIANNGTLTLTNSVLTGNQAHQGGALFSDGTLTLTDSRIQGNTADIEGGGLLLRGTADIRQTLISGNNALQIGGGVFQDNGTTTLTGVTISGNDAPFTGGIKAGVYITDLVIYNSLIIGNSNADIANDFEGAIPTAYNSLIPSGESSLSGSGSNNNMMRYRSDNIFIAPQDPTSAPTTAGDYRLTDASPAIDMGHNAFAAANGIGSTDLAGNPRYLDDSYVTDTGNGTAPLIDAGAYEFQNISCPGYTFPYTVTGGVPDLIQAMLCANATSTADIIDLGNNTLTFTSTYWDYGTSGISYIQGLPRIDEALTLQQGTLTADAQVVPDYWLRGIASLTLDSITMQNMAVSTSPNTGNNSALFSPTLTIQNSVFDNLFSRVIIMPLQGTLTITDSVFRNMNTAPDARDKNIIRLTSQSTSHISGTHFENNRTLPIFQTYGVNTTLTDTEFIGNAVGAVDATYGSLTIEDSLFVSNGNSAKLRGGAIDASGTDLTITGSLFSGNIADTSAAISSSGGNVILVNTTISGNQAATTGAVTQNSAPLTISNSIIWNNSPAAIVNDSGTTTVSYSLVEGWTGSGTGNITAGYVADELFTAPESPANAPTPAGDYSLREASPAIDTASNTAASGAGIGTTDLTGNPRYADDPGTGDSGDGTAPLIDMGAYEFQGTSCTAYTFPYTVTGGASDLINAIQCANANGTADVIDFNNSTMTLTTAFADFGELVGLPGINSAITLQNGTIERNIASSTLFGLLYVSNTGELTVNNVTMRNGGDLNNSSGGAIHVLGRATIENSTFQNNQAVTGGAIQAAFAPMIIRNSLFENNQAAIAGGAIFAAGDNLSIEDSTFSQNSTDGFGGAIFLNNQSSAATTAAAVHTSTFSNNQAERGGAIDVAGASLTVEDSVFENNQATRNTGETGGAISAIPQTINSQTYTGTLTILNSVFRGNQATTSGGAIHTEIPTTLTQNLFSGNLAGTDGGALYSRADTTLTNSTLSGNRSNAGSAIYSQSGALTATNSIIWNNSPITLVVLNSAGSSINYSLVQGWSGGGTGNILTGYTAADIFTAPQDPASAPTTAGDYSLRERSPSIDAASNTAADSNSIGTTDLAGNPRYADDPGTGDSGEGSAPLIDMGAYEFQGASPAGLDVNNDGIISPADVIYVINRLGSADLSADVDGDGDIDTDDVTAIQNELGNPAP